MKCYLGLVSDRSRFVEPQCLSCAARSAIELHMDLLGLILSAISTFYYLQGYLVLDYRSRLLLVVLMKG